jgi:hypothetical protein
VTTRLSGAAAQEDFERSLNELLQPAELSSLGLAAAGLAAIGIAGLAGWTIRRYRRTRRLQA